MSVRDCDVRACSRRLSDVACVGWLAVNTPDVHSVRAPAVHGVSSISPIYLLFSKVYSSFTLNSSTHLIQAPWIFKPVLFTLNSSTFPVKNRQRVKNSKMDGLNTIFADV